jgi:hypothetical protein
MEVDYLKVSEQYANFLIAIGGVSITVLALVLTFDSKTNAFLVAALVVATISCFTGAHMMAETAAFINSHPNVISSGQRLFLLASINIFIAVVLVIFALMLLPIASGKVDVDSIKPISISVFVFVIIAVLSWMWLSFYRMPAPHGRLSLVMPAIVSILWSWRMFSRTSKKSPGKLREKFLLKSAFIPIIFFTFISLIRFALTLNDGGKVDDIDIELFSLAITSACASLIVVAWMQLELKWKIYWMPLKLKWKIYWMPLKLKWKMWTWGKFGDKDDNAANLNLMADIAHLQGDYGEAKSKASESLKISEELGNKQGKAASLHLLAKINHSQGNTENSIGFSSLSVLILSLNNFGGLEKALSKFNFYAGKSNYSEDKIKKTKEKARSEYAKDEGRSWIEELLKNS